MKDVFPLLDTDPGLPAAYARARRHFARRPGVVGVGVGRARRDGRLTRRQELVIRVFVARKRPEKELRPEDILPRELGGFRVDVQELRLQGDGVDSVPFDPDWMGEQETVSPGMSIGNADGPAGTLGLVALEQDTLQPCFVSADHVLAPEGVGGTLILQPAPEDGGIPEIHGIGRLWKRRQRLGVAIASVDSLRTVERRQHGTDYVCTQIRFPAPGEKVSKVGRSTRLTRGVVRDYVDVPGCAAGVLIWPHGGPHVDHEISMGGDSGALWFAEADGAGVAIHCAGEAGDVPGVEWALGASLFHAAEALGFRV